MYCWPEGTKIVIYGNNRLTEKICVFYRHCFDIQYIIAHNEDELKKSGPYNIPVVGPGRAFLDSKTDDYKILVANNNPAAFYLFKHMKPYDQYIPYAFFDYDSIDIALLESLTDSVNLKETVRKLKRGRQGAILHGNCQMRMIELYLNSSKAFRERYIILKIPRIFEFNESNLKIMDSDVLRENTDLLIYHKIKPNNRFGEKLSSDYLKSRLRKDAVKLEVSNLWFSGYFPQAERNTENVLNSLQYSGLFPYGDKYVRQLKLSGHSKDDIIGKIQDRNFVSREEIETCVEHNFSEMESREQTADIRMLDFVRSNYKERLLFHSPNHPTHFLMKEITKRILNRLGIDDACFEKEYWQKLRWNLRGQDMPIYPSVADYYHINDDEMLYYANAGILDKMLTLEEWVSLFYDSLADRV